MGRLYVALMGIMSLIVGYGLVLLNSCSQAITLGPIAGLCFLFGVLVLGAVAYDCLTQLRQPFRERVGRMGTRTPALQMRRASLHHGH